MYSIHKSKNLRFYCFSLTLQCYYLFVLNKISLLICVSACIGFLHTVSIYCISLMPCFLWELLFLRWWPHTEYIPDIAPSIKHYKSMKHHLKLLLKIYTYCFPIQHINSITPKNFKTCSRFVLFTWCFISGYVSFQIK